ncbi:ABC transporter permease [Brachybacterium hainanense]|uniref:ABC transporter permease n=1 Tax=Brachybacterium hainanense TaxID=1541174 RepID=A0ABV6RA32_9MICO
MANEFAKMRHLRVGLIATILVVAVLGLSLIGVVSDPTFDPAAAGAWLSMLAGLSLGIPLVAPLLLAVLASRQVDIEHQGSGWLLQTTAGLAPGIVCRAKFCALGAVVLLATLATSLVSLALGRVLAGISAPPPLGHWAGFTACILVVNLTLLAAHVLLAALVENQLIGLGLAVLGTLLGLFSKNLPEVLAHLTPWGCYALAEAASYRDGELVALPISYPSFVALGVLGGAVFTLVTSRFDRQEA